MDFSSFTSRALACPHRRPRLGTRSAVSTQRASASRPGAARRFICLQRQGARVPPGGPRGRQPQTRSAPGDREV